MRSLVIKTCHDHPRLPTGQGAKPMCPPAMWVLLLDWQWERRDLNQVTVLLMNSKAAPVLSPSWPHLKGCLVVSVGELIKS